MSGENGVVSEESKYQLKFVPVSLDSLDARILQYKYALVKLKHLIDAIDGILKGGKDAQDVVLIHYIIHLCSNLFAIGDTGFFAKMAELEAFRMPRSLSVAVSQVVKHVPYDMKDHNVVPLFTLPSAKTSLTCLKAFRALCVICRDSYEKRYANASRELGNEAFLGDLEFLFSRSFFNTQKDFDLTLKSHVFKAALVFRLDPEISSDDYMEASLIDIDVFSLFTIVHETSRMLQAQKSSIDTYKTIKVSPATMHERKLKEQAHSSYALHRVFFWALRMNELYFILRKFGRQIFISNREHLDDERFMSYVSNPGVYRSMLLKIQENLFHTKKNGVLIATITRFLRLDSNHQICSKTVLEFVGFIYQSVVYMESMLSILKTFGHLWLETEISFRRAHNLPTENLLNLNDIIVEEKGKELKAKRRVQPKASVVPRTTVKRPSPPVLGEARANGLVNKASKETLKQPLYLQKHSSTSSLQSATSISSTSSAEKVASPREKTPPVELVNRRRSMSQPISLSAAASALKASSGSISSVKQDLMRSPTGSLRRSSSFPKRPPTTLSSSTSKPLAMKSVKETKEATETIEVKRSASQKFQQHLLEASRSGALYGIEKEKLSHVVFNPNNPSATNLRRPPKQASENLIVDEKKEVVGVVSPSNVNEVPTRAQVTKMNTRRNSVMQGDNPKRNSSVQGDNPKRKSVVQGDNPKSNSVVQGDNPKRNSVVVQGDNTSRLSDLSRHSVISASSQSSPTESILIKKVRFIGVPEYTPAEDAPESQTSKILKSFAALKIPTVGSSGIKRKDEMLKKEESQLFRQTPARTQPQPQPETTVFPSDLQAPSKFTRFRNRF